MKKRVLALFLSVMMAFALCPAVFAADAPTSGKCGDNLTWRLADDTLYIEGTGDMYDFLDGEKGDVGIAPWKDADIYDYYTWEGEGLKVKIAPGVTSVGDYAFNGLDVLDVSLPEGITKIGEYAFAGCQHVVKISLPESLNSIDTGAFWWCSEIATVDFPSRMTYIGESAFTGCLELESVRVPEGITRIEFGTFESCGNLSSLSLPTTLVSIGNLAFSDCRNLTEVDIPKSVNTIDIMAFSGCQRIKSIIVPEGVTELWGVFNDCRSLKEVTIPVSITTISSSAFQDCRNLTDVYYGGNQRQWQELKEKSWEWSKELDEATIHYNSGPAKPVPTFTDVPAGAWYADAVSWAVGLNITQGTGDGKFSPQQQCTQAEIITFLWRAAGEPEPAAAVTGTEFYAQAVQWAREKKIIDSSFELFKLCTRKTAVTYMWKYAGSPTDAPAASFPDVPAGSDFAKAVAWALQQEVTEGTDQGLFLPETVCDRGQIVTFLHRAFG